METIVNQYIDVNIREAVYRLRQLKTKCILYGYANNFDIILYE